VETDSLSLELVMYKLDDGDFGQPSATPSAITVTYEFHLLPSGREYELRRNGQTVARQITDPVGFGPVGAISETAQITATMTSMVNRSGEDRDQSGDAELVFHRRPSD
jgi:hypothetical protein